MGLSRHVEADVTGRRLAAVVDGDKLLADVEDFVRRFVAFPSEDARIAFVLWAAHTHALSVFESTPRLALLSPEPGSGKTRAQEVLDLLVPRPMFTLNASAAALFRRASDPEGRPTVLLDEADTVFGPRASKDHEDLRGFVNGGHRRGATAFRCVVRGKSVEVEEYSCFAAVSLSGLDDLPDTVMTRSVVIRMRRRAPHEVIEPFRYRLHAPEGQRLAGRLAEWASAVESALDGAWPELPPGVEDRLADVWEPLVAIADAAGGAWPQRARAAAVALVGAARQGGETLGIRLLADLRSVFRAAGEHRLPTEAILAALNGMVSAPWGDLKGKPLDARGLSRRLARYGVQAKSAKVDGRTVRVYESGDLLDPWSRYLVDDDVAAADLGPVPSLPMGSATSATVQPSPTAEVAVVAEVADLGETGGTCSGCGLPISELRAAYGLTTCSTCETAPQPFVAGVLT